MKTYDQRTREILGKANEMKKTHRKKVLGAVSAVCCLVVVMGLVLFMPYNTEPPSVKQHAKSEYYDLICALNPLTYQKPTDHNRFESWFGNVSLSGAMIEGIPVPDAAEAAPGNTGAVSKEDGYVEVTDNQVTGIIEGDLVKRSGQYLYYLSVSRHLRIYSIAQDQSALVGEYDILNQNDEKLNLYGNDVEMFLSSDCSTVTFVTSGYHKEFWNSLVCVISLDVSDPGKIRESGRLYFTGSPLSSRMVGDEILLMSQFRVKYGPDFENEAEFVPQYGQLDNLQSIPMEDIITPENPTDARYTVLSRIDPKSLEVKDTAALLSYANEVYVNADTIVVSRGYSDKTDLGEGRCQTESKTELCGIGYDGDVFKRLGTANVAGSLLNQYSMDIHNGILRVVTTTRKDTWAEESTSNGSAYSDIVLFPVGNSTSASLYCIDLADWKTVASVENFAPKGETVRSVRFDGDKAYVCTAVQLKDPVFFFDLSDLSHITYKDTGTIDGFSSSLVNLGGGYLLGIGYGSGWGMKIEIYEQTANGVASVCSYEADADFSQDYKSYLIDRENGYLGLGVLNWNGEGRTEYLLLRFDGYKLRPVLQEPLQGALDEMRAVIIDGWIYLLGSDFIVKPL